MEYTRRKFIEMGALFGGSAVAGCTSDSNSEKKKEKLKRVILKNSTATTQEVRVNLDKDGKLVLDEDYHLEPKDKEGNKVRLVSQWGGNEASKWKVSARVEGSDWQTESFDNKSPPYCHDVHIEVHDREWDPMTLLVGLCEEQV